MTNNLNDQDIISLYQKGATEEPSPSLDALVLDYAKIKPGSHHQRWSYIGLAASIGLVAIIAPWKWADKTSPALYDQELLQTAPQAISESVDSPRALMKSSPSPAFSNDIGKREVILEKRHMASETLEMASNPFAEIEQLLAENKKKQARVELQKLLSQQPELRDSLPDNLGALLDN